VNPFIPYARVHALENAEAERGDHMRNWMSKMNFPHFDGSDPRIWLDKCSTYFALYHILVAFRVPAASIHLIGAAAQWF
jgi:hypothetical protein